MELVVEDVLIIAAVAMLLIFFVGFPYVKGAREIQENKMPVFDKQSYVKQNLDKFGVKDGEAHELTQIYSVSPEKMGF